MVGDQTLATASGKRTPIGPLCENDGSVTLFFKTSLGQVGAPPGQVGTGSNTARRHASNSGKWEPGQMSVESTLRVLLFLRLFSCLDLDGQASVAWLLLTTTNRNRPPSSAVAARSSGTRDPRNISRKSIIGIIEARPRKVTFRNSRLTVECLRRAEPRTADVKHVGGQWTIFVNTLYWFLNIRNSGIESQSSYKSC